jgi:hypothetical protein
MAVWGTLDDFPLSELLSVFGNRNASGHLIMKRGANRVTCTIAQGQIVAVEPLHVTQRFGSRLLNECLLTPSQLEQALGCQQDGAARALGGLLVELGFHEPDDIRTALKTHFIELLYEFISSEEGEFWFTPCDTAVAGVDPQFTVSELVFRAMLRADEAIRDREKVTTIVGLHSAMAS